MYLSALGNVTILSRCCVDEENAIQAPLWTIRYGRPVPGRDRQLHSGILAWLDRSKLIGTSRRPAVLAQERPKVFPCPAFAPSVPQGPAPSAFGLEVCSRGRVYYHPDAVAAFLVAGDRTAWQCAEPKVLLDSFASVERRGRTRQRDSRRTRTGSLRQNISVPFFSSRQVYVEAASLNSMEFPVTKPRNIDAGRNGRLSRIGWLSMSRLHWHIVI